MLEMLKKIETLSASRTSSLKNNMIGSVNSNFYFSFPNEGHEKTLSFILAPFFLFVAN